MKYSKMEESKKKQILVLGDLSTDLVKNKYISDEKKNAWDFDGYTISELDGGALLLAEMIKD